MKRNFNLIRVFINSKIFYKILANTKIVNVDTKFKVVFTYYVLFFILYFSLNIIYFDFGIPEFFLNLTLIDLNIIEPFDMIILLSNTVPIKIYHNTDLNNNIIIQENNKKTGIYQFINLLTGKSYVGSSIYLSRRFR